MMMVLQMLKRSPIINMTEIKLKIPQPQHVPLQNNYSPKNVEKVTGNNYVYDKVKNALTSNCSSVE